jgi:hypothetical protein
MLPFVAAVYSPTSVATLAPPGAYEIGDLLVAAVGVDSYGGATGPATAPGWAELGHDTGALSWTVLCRKADGGANDTITVTQPGTGGSIGAISIACYRSLKLPGLYTGSWDSVVWTADVFTYPSTDVPLPALSVPSSKVVLAVLMPGFESGSVAPVSGFDLDSWGNSGRGSKTIAWLRSTAPISGAAAAAGSFALIAGSANGFGEMFTADPAGGGLGMML